MKKRFKDLPNEIYYSFADKGKVPNNYLKMHGYVMERKKSFGWCGRWVSPLR